MCAQFEFRHSRAGDCSDFRRSIDAAGGTPVSHRNRNSRKLVSAFSSDRGDRTSQAGSAIALKTGPHEGFILGLIDETTDITLAEIAERMMTEHSVGSRHQRCGCFSPNVTLHSKKDSACERAATR